MSQQNCDRLDGYMHLRCVVDSILDRKFQGRGL